MGGKQVKFTITGQRRVIKMHNVYIQFKDNEFDGFSIQMLKDEPVIKTRKVKKTEMVLIDGIETEQVETIDEQYIDGYQQVAAELLPENAVIITNEQHEQYLTALNSQLQQVVLVDGEIQIVDKYTPEELAAKQATEAAALLVNQANALLRASDYRLIPDEYAELTTDQQTELVAYRAQLRLVARGESAELPTISF